MDAVITNDDCSPLLFEILQEQAPSIVRILDMSAAELHYMRAIYDKDAELMPQFAKRLHYEYAKVWNNAIMDKCLREVKASQYFLTPSAFVRRSLRYTGVKDAQMLNCPYGVDISEFSCKVYPKCHNSAPLKFVYVGGVKELKGISYLLEAFMQIPREQAELTVIGDFKAEDCDIKRYLNQVHFTGMVLHSEVSLRLRESDVFIFTSLGDSFALAALEAAASGLPLIISENTGISDYIQEGREGFIIPIQDIDAIVQKVKWFCEHRERIEPMGQAARKMALQFTWERYYEQVSQLVKEVVSNEKNCHFAGR